MDSIPRTPNMEVGVAWVAEQIKRAALSTAEGRNMEQAVEGTEQG